jgi:hypothetical protein
MIDWYWEDTLCDSDDCLEAVRPLAANDVQLIESSIRLEVFVASRTCDGTDYHSWTLPCPDGARR